MTIFCPKGIGHWIGKLIVQGYSSLKESAFLITFTEVEKSFRYGDYSLSFAETTHPVKNLAIRIEEDKKVLCYSGDGMYTPQTEELYRAADLLVHEANWSERRVGGHTTVNEAIELAKRTKVKSLALVHLKASERDKIDLKAVSPKALKVLMPKPMDALEV